MTANDIVVDKWGQLPLKLGSRLRTTPVPTFFLKS